MIGTRLKFIREKRGYTQEGLAELVDTTQLQVSRWENNRSSPSSEMLVKVATSLEITSDYLLGLVDEPNQHLEEGDLSPDEWQLIMALRRGTPAQVFKSLAELTDADAGGPVAGEEETVNG